VPGYREERDVAPGSGTPTYVACRVTLDNWRWSGVPFYLRTGKRMRGKLSKVAIRFRPTPHRMFPLELPASDLVFRLQPREGILQTFAAKEPGPELSIRAVRSCFLYGDAFGVAHTPPAYAWLLRDIMQGDQTLFARTDWIDRAWTVVDPIPRAQDAGRHPSFPNYTAGSEGPDAAQALIARDGRLWRAV
jgi:glucose-6-phosphate 1-dehydrogenase